MKPALICLLLLATSRCCSAAEDLGRTVKLLQEQVAALLEHRQEDYDKLEESLKRTMERNTELIVLRNEVKLLRKEIINLRNNAAAAPSLTKSDSSPLLDLGDNEAKNDRLRLRWLASAVTELQHELAEVLRARNASEELAERERLRAELELVRGDVAGAGRDVRELSGRLAKFEASVGAVKMEVVGVSERQSQLSRTCADVSSQLSAIQMEVKSIKWDDCEHHQTSPEDVLLKSDDGDNNAVEPERKRPRHHRRSQHHHRHAHSRLPSSALHRLDERMDRLEHKLGLVSRRRALQEKRVVYEEDDGLSRRVHLLESMGRDLMEKVRNATGELAESTRCGASAVRMLAANQSESRREIARLDVSAARKAAELSLTRDELGSLRKAVQALSVSASKLRERSDAQQESIGRLSESLSKLNLEGSVARAENVTRELEHVEDEYRMMVDALPGNCDKKDGLTLLAPGPGAPLLAACRKGWIVVGRRVDGTVDFDRSWNDYATGFGSPINEFWAGNEALHRLSRDNCTRLRIELNDIDGNYWVANYEDFSVDGEEHGYRLRVAGFTGNATDAMSYQNNMKFSAKDRDMDISSTDCAANYHGGWWFSHCQHANLNGRYSLGLTWYRSDSNEWMAVASTELSVQRKEQCL